MDLLIKLTRQLCLHPGVKINKWENHHKEDAYSTYC